MKVRYTLTARFQIMEIADYISRANPSASVKVERKIRETIALLKDYPHRGRRQRTRGVRRLGAGRFPYHIYYRVDEAEQMVIILSIRHAARKRRHRDA